MTNKKKSILKRGIKLFKENFYKSSFEDWYDYLGRIFWSIVFLILHTLSCVVVYATFGGLKGLFISGFLFSIYALFAFNAEYTLPIAIVAILFSIAFPAFKNINDEYKEQSKATRSTTQTFAKEYDYSEKDKQIKKYINTNY